MVLYTFSVKGQMRSILGITGHMVSLAPSQPPHRGAPGQPYRVCEQVGVAGLVKLDLGSQVAGCWALI